jgi:hypothetical protein
MKLNPKFKTKCAYYAVGIPVSGSAGCSTLNFYDDQGNTDHAWVKSPLHVYTGKVLSPDGKPVDTCLEYRVDNQTGNSLGPITSE